MFFLKSPQVFIPSLSRCHERHTTKKCKKRKKGEKFSYLFSSRLCATQSWSTAEIRALARFLPPLRTPFLSFDFFQDFLFFDCFLNLFVLLSSLRPSTRSLLPCCFFPSFSSFPSSFPSFSSSGQFLSLAPGLPPGPPTPPHCVGRATLEFNGPLPQGEWRGPVRREGSTTHRERERKREGERERERERETPSL